VSTAPVIREALTQIFPNSSQTIEHILAESSSPSTKSALTQTTNDAVKKYGAFGAPFIVVEEDGKEPECFWGSDRFEALAFHIKKPWLGPVPSQPTAKL
jgi:glutathione S-transferase kappa 1